MIHVKPKFCENANICYLDTVSFISHVKIEDSYKDIADDIETRFDTSNCKLRRSLLKGKNEKLTRLMKDKLGE